MGADRSSYLRSSVFISVPFLQIYESPTWMLLEVFLRPTVLVGVPILYS
jgi:hypothetical protein